MEIKFYRVKIITIYVRINFQILQVFINNIWLFIIQILFKIYNTFLWKLEVNSRLFKTYLNCLIFTLIIYLFILNNFQTLIGHKISLRGFKFQIIAFQSLIITIQLLISPKISIIAKFFNLKYLEKTILIFMTMELAKTFQFTFIQTIKTFITLLPGIHFQ